jgi:pimeloyl-ACP methyl ester carboxylesterase
MFTEKDAAITGNTELFWQNVQFIYGLFMLMGHRIPLSPDLAAQAEKMGSSGHIEDVVGRYVHVELDGHTYRTFFEESGAKDAIPMVCLHAANIDARAWRHQLADPDYISRFRVIAFDMPWHGWDGDLHPYGNGE